MADQKILEDFLTTPLKEYKGAHSPFLSDNELGELIQKMEFFLTSTAPAEIEQSNLLYWLTHALANAMKNNNFSCSHKIATLLYKMSEKFPQMVISMLGKTIETGDFKGQTGIFVWTDKLYSATFNSIFSPTLIVINSIFSHLLEKDSEALALITAKPIESGFTTGTNALLNLIYALKNAAEYDNNQPTTVLITKLLAKFINCSPDKLGFAIIQDVTKGIFSGINLIDLLVTALAKTSTDNLEATKIISDIFLTVNNIHHRLLIASLTKIYTTGYNKGVHALHLILSTLVSAAYIQNNTEAFIILVNLIRTFFEQDPAKISTVLVQPIENGERYGENGIMHLVHALIIAMEHQIDTESLTNLLLKIISFNGQELFAAFTSDASSKSNHYLVSPLTKLEMKLCNELTSPLHKKEIDALLTVFNELTFLKNM